MKNPLSLFSRKKTSRPSAHVTFAFFLAEAEKEIDALIETHPRWFLDLPYSGAMSREEARKLEIEKRALWRRVIYDARRSNLPALRWETSKDEKVCAECRNLEGRIFSWEEYDRLNEIRMHVGCRCNLVPVR